MKMLLLSLLLAHGSSSAHFSVTCTVVRKLSVSVSGNTVFYADASGIPEPRIVDGMINF